MLWNKAAIFKVLRFSHSQTYQVITWKTLNKHTTKTQHKQEGRGCTADIAGYGYICFHRNLSQFMCAHDLVVPFMSKAFV